MDFTIPQYDSLFRRNFEFEQYGNKTHFWVELDYYILRDSFSTRVGRALDTNMLSAGGQPIFTGSVKEQITAKNMVLISESVATVTRWQDIYKVTELYGYAPNLVFETWTAEVAWHPGIEDPSGALKVLITTKSGLCDFDAANNTFLLHLGTDIVKQFAAGDSIRFYGASKSSNYYPLECPTVNIIEIDKDAGTMKTPAFSGIFNGGRGASLSSREISWFLNATLYVDGTYVSRDTYIIREAKATAAKNTIRPTAVKIEYTATLPALTDKFVVFTASGVETDKITTQTVPTVAEWKARIANGEYYAIAASEIDSKFAPQIYIKKTKFVKCF